MSLSNIANHQQEFSTYKKKDVNRFCVENTHNSLSSGFNSALRLAPQSDNFRLVFQWSHKFNKYNTQDFFQQKVENISNEELDAFIFSLNHDVKYKIKEEVQKVPCYIEFIKYLSQLGFILLLIVFTCLGGDWQGYPIISLTFVIYTIIMYLFIKIHLKKVVLKKQQLRENELQNIAAKWNKDVFQKNGYKITIGNKTAYLILHIKTKCIQDGFPQDFFNNIDLLKNKGNLTYTNINYQMIPMSPSSNHMPKLPLNIDFYKNKPYKPNLLLVQQALSKNKLINNNKNPSTSKTFKYTKEQEDYISQILNPKFNQSDHLSNDDYEDPEMGHQNMKQKKNKQF